MQSKKSELKQTDAKKGQITSILDLDAKHIKLQGTVHAPGLWAISYVANIKDSPRGTSCIVSVPPTAVKFGLPKYDAKWHPEGPEGKSMQLITMAENVDDPKSVAVFDAMQKIDDHFKKIINEQKNKDGTINKKLADGTFVPLSKPTYKPMIKLHEPREDDDNKKSFPPFRSFKFRLATKYEKYDKTKEPNKNPELDVSLFIGDSQESEDIKKVSDLRQFYQPGAEAWYVLQFSTMRLQLTGERSCNFVIKCLQIGITKEAPVKEQNNVALQLRRPLFPVFSQNKQSSNDDDDDDDDEEDKKVVVSSVQPKKQSAKKEESDNDEDEDDEDEEDEDEDEDESDDEDDKKKPIPTKQAVPAKKVVIAKKEESDDDSDDDTTPPPKTSKAKSGKKN